LRQNDFGGTLGGPILIPRAYNGKEKSFFFVSYEGLRLTQPQAAAIQYVPDNYMRQQAPDALQALLNAYPEQNGFDYGTSLAPSLAEFIKSYSLPSQVDSTSVWIDHSFTPKLSGFFRYGYTPSSATTRALSVASQRQANVQSYTAGLTSQLAGNNTNEFRAGYARSNSSSIGHLDTFGGASPINMQAAMGVDGNNNPESAIQLYFPTIGSSQLAVSTARNQGRQWNITDTFSMPAGHHWLQFGVDYLRMESPTSPPSPIARKTMVLFSALPTSLGNR
jgi:hypothetical protein